MKPMMKHDPSVACATSPLLHRGDYDSLPCEVRLHGLQVVEQRRSSCRGEVASTASRWGHFLLCLFLLSGLTACKIDLSIFGKGTVQTQSGTFDCVGTGTYDENDNPIMTGDCEQTYNVDATEEACDYDDPNDPYDTFDPDCTRVEENDVIPEVWVASPEQDGMFNGFAGHCTQGTGSCTHEIIYDNANLAQDVLIEAHFEPEPAPQEVTYTHNYLGQMASMTVNNVTTFYVYDEQGRTLSEINEAGESIKDYIYAETERVAWVEKSGDTGDSETEEQVFYPLTNHLGQPFMTIRADEALGHEQYADPFGKVQAMYIDKSLGVDNIGPLPLTDGLPGQRLQPSGYYDNHYRTYDPSTGRELQADPRGIMLDFSDPDRQMAVMMGIAIPENPGMGYVNHSYNYVDNNPVNNVDPTGEFPWIKLGFGTYCLYCILTPDDEDNYCPNDALPDPPPPPPPDPDACNKGENNSSTLKYKDKQGCY